MKNAFWIAACFILAWIAIILMYVPAIPQSLDYHKFADQNTLFNIPNFWNVLSNLPFLVVGFLGLQYTIKISITNFEQILYIVLFSGIFLTGCGSAYYHWQPNNWALVFDRLPMTFVFMSFFTLILADIFNRNDALRLFPFLLFLGFFSVVYWYYTETIGQGDLRLYGIVQFLPMLLIPFLAIIYRNKINYLSLILRIFGAYALAKILEKMDFVIFEWSVLGGHCLKHIFAAWATFLIYQIVKKRKNS